MPGCAWTQFQGGSFCRRRRRSKNRMGLRSCEDQRRDETAPENAGPLVPQRYRRVGESNDRKNGGVVLEETGVSMPRALRDRGARNTDRAVRLSRRIRNRNETLNSNSNIGRVRPDSVYVCATRWFARKRRQDGEPLLH